jgi:hypothetical protein
LSNIEKIDRGICFDRIGHCIEKEKRAREIITHALLEQVPKDTPTCGWFDGEVTNR